jgi:hypothetical protein
MAFGWLVTLTLASPGGPDGPLLGDAGYCVAAGYCTSRPGDSGRPAGPMYLAIGLVGTGLASLRRERQA